MSQTYAYVPALPGPVVEVIAPFGDFAIADRFSPDFVAHCYPCDDTVQQRWTTQDGMAFTPPVVLAIDLTAYAPIAQAALLVKGQTFNVAASGATAVPILCDGTSATRADLALLALYGQANPTGTKTWIDNDGVVTVLTGTQCVTLATLAGNWVSDTYAALVTLFGEIEAGTIATTAQVMAYAWPTS